MGVCGQRHASAALPQERRSTQCIGGWVGLRADLDGCGKSHPHRDSIPGPSSPWRVAIPTELSRPVYVYTHIYAFSYNTVKLKRSVIMK
jgi:hypothetical protein